MKTLGLLGLLLLPQDRLPADQHPWLRHKPGSTATYKSTITYGALTQEGALTYALKEGGADGGYAVSVKAAQLGQEATSEETFGPPAKAGTETIRVGDRDFACTVWTSTGRRAGKPLTARWWIADNAPLPLRVHLAVEGEEDFDVTARALDEALTVDGRRYACLRLEGRSRTGGEESRVVLWSSPDVPGGVVRMTGAGTIKGQRITSTLELTSMSAK